MSTSRRFNPVHHSEALPLQGALIPLLRRWLVKGVSDANLRSGTRVQAWTPLSGGLKSPLVADVELSLRVVIKQGSSELLLHQLLMNAVNCHAAARRTSIRGLQDAVFPEVMLVEKVLGQVASSDHVMVQQALVKYESIMSRLYDSGASDIWNCVRPGVLALDAIHSLAPTSRGRLSTLPSTPDPFSDRIAARLKALRTPEPWLDGLWRSPSTIEGLSLEPLGTLLPRLRRWQTEQGKRVALRLVHGDAHLANLMTRSRGRFKSVRWIDPNPTLGFSDPAYDWGKILHFAENVGWAKHDPAAVRTQVRGAARSCAVNTVVGTVPASREARRADLELALRRAALRALKARSNPVASLELAIASAHIGLAGLDTGSGDPAIRQRRQFALARSLAALARWSAAVAKP